MSVSEALCFSPVLELPRRRLFGFTVARLGDGIACLTAALQCAASWGGRDQPVVLLDADLDPDGAICARLADGLLAAPHPEAVVVRVPRFQRVDPASILERLVDRGVTVAVREVDLGAAELGLLAGAPIDLLELPAAAVAALDRDRTAALVVERRIALAHHHDWLTLATDVHRAEQLALLERLGCDLVCGPAIGPAMTRTDADRLVDRRRAARPTASPPSL